MARDPPRQVAAFLNGNAVSGCQGELGLHRNLMVGATGTGKTVMAAIDYRALLQSGRVDTTGERIRRAPGANLIAAAGARNGRHGV